LLFKQYLKTMKKIIISGLCYAAISCMVLMSCGKTQTCVNLITAVTTASNNYASEQTKANCEAYKTAMQNWINNADCSNADATTKTDFKAAIDSMVCQ
jgi:hypothetical protein